MKKSLLCIVFFAASLVAAVVEASPIYTCPNASSECMGQTFALWVSGSGVNAGGQYYDISVSIDTTGYTGSESDLAHGVEFKNVTDSNTVYANITLLSAPGGLANWTADTGQLNPGQECTGGDDKNDTGCAIWLVNPGGHDFTIGDILTWTFRFNATSLGDGTGHLKYYYVEFTPCEPKQNDPTECKNGTGEWAKSAGLLSQDIPLQDCLNGDCEELNLPEPATLVLVGLGLVGAARARRRRARTAA